MTRHAISPGSPVHLGATADDGGVNFAVFSAHATAVDLCLFDAGIETRLPLDRDGDIWCGRVDGLGPGQAYGYRAHGPYAPDAGHRFNPNKLLTDPYARQIDRHPVWDDALFGYHYGQDDRTFDDRDSAPWAARSIVTPPAPAPLSPGPRTPWDRSVLYEAHVKGLTQCLPGVRAPGTFAALADPAVIGHLHRLGVTAIELLPVQAYINDRRLADLGLTNYWGYQTIGFFAPDPRYLPGADVLAFRRTVAALHDAGIEVILDVVYNHTGEGDELGPTVCFRGLDNASYYRLQDGGRTYANDAGTGNTLNLRHPIVLRMVMDSLRYWATTMGVDGFRFDLATTLARGPAGFEPDAPFLHAIRQDPVLRHVKLIAEPWDVGPGGYQLGAFPPPFFEWNDKFRDDARRFWRGDTDTVRKLARRMTGSAPQFDHHRRPATASINMITAHDGFTLADVVAYRQKHNAANGEDGRDGHDANHSDNFGHEGPTDDAAIAAARARRVRAMLATLLFSQGTPMLLAGDELGHSQGGNNNAYAQDNRTSWIDWPSADQALIDFVARLISLRARLPHLRQLRFLHGARAADGGAPDLIWRRPDGIPCTDADWHNPESDILIAEIRLAAGASASAAPSGPVLLICNAGGDLPVTLPPGNWTRLLDSANPCTGEAAATNPLTVPGQSVVLLAAASASKGARS